MNLTDFTTLSFDVYGTLIDWESGILANTKGLRENSATPISDNQVLQAHAYYESFHQCMTPQKNYKDLLATVYRRLAEELNITVGWEECLEYGHSVKDWPLFSDSADSLAYLKQHFRLVVLSNVDNLSFSSSNEKLNVDFDAVYTAEDIGSYKPSERNFTYMLDTLGRLGIERTQLLHVAESMFHDHLPANTFGLENCHIYRRHTKKGFGATMTPENMPSLSFQFNSMAELVKAHRQELSECHAL